VLVNREPTLARTVAVVERRELRHGAGRGEVIPCETVDGEDLGEAPHTDIDMPWLAETPMPHAPAGPSPLGAGYLILVARELTGLPQSTLASRAATSQPAIARLETGNALPSIRTLLRIVEAAGFHLVLGLRRPEAPSSDPAVLQAQGFALVGTLHANPDDGLADFTVLREPSPLEGPR
jgi:transcriptional regulator with XRE-family HTH domain